MSRISIPPVASATGAVAELYSRIRKTTGGLPDLYAIVGALQPQVLGAVLDAEAVLAAGSLSRQDIETVKLAVSAAAECDYCLAAHAMLGRLAGLSPETLRNVRAGRPTGDAKRDALASFARSLVQTSGTIPGEAFAAIKNAGYTDQQLAEISLAIALTVFTNVFNRINDTGIDFPPVNRSEA